MRVLLATAEAVPFVKTGGLADVAGSLPRALNALGADVSVILPEYSIIPDEYRSQMEQVAQFYVPLAWRQVYCGIKRLRYDGVTFYFVDNEDYFKRDGGPYGFYDDGERFAYFSKAICQAIMWLPELQVDAVHCNDWQTALVPVFLREFYRASDACNHVKCVFTVHNVKFQGQFGDDMLANVLGLDGIPAARDQLRSDDHSINYMRGALCYSDRLTTVSPSYAVELQMPFYGEGMDGIFRRRSSVLSGILNGIDTKLWDPATDPLVPVAYDATTLDEKAKDKASLQVELGLNQDPTRPLVVMIGRLTNQKGLGLVRYAMDGLMRRSVQIAILGTGDRDQEEAFRYFSRKYPGQMAAVLKFDNALSHRMYAGGDILLMPSEFEPCGLSQMIAMRYGTLPVVRKTGGLRDSVVPYNKYTGEGTGFSFENMNADEMADTLLGACEIFWTDKQAWRKLQLQAMATDFSWDRAAHEYLDLYFDLHPEIERPAEPEPEPAPEPEQKAEPEPAATAVAVSKAELVAEPKADPEPQAAAGQAPEATPAEEPEPVEEPKPAPAPAKPAARRTRAKKAVPAKADAPAAKEPEAAKPAKAPAKKAAAKKPAAKKAEPKPVPAARADVEPKPVPVAKAAAPKRRATKKADAEPGPAKAEVAPVAKAAEPAKSARKPRAKASAAKPAEATPTPAKDAAETAPKATTAKAAPKTVAKATAAKAATAKAAAPKPAEPEKAPAARTTTRRSSKKKA